MSFLIHDVFVKELFEKKSLSALAFLIDAGRELEVNYNNTEYFISCNKSSKNVSIWCGNNEQSFDSIYELIEKAVLYDATFLSLWNDIKFGTLF